MVEITSISNPVQAKPQAQAIKPSPDATQAFDLIDLTKVIKTNQKGETLKQNLDTALNKGLPQQVLSKVLRDPSLASSALKGMLSTEMLQQIATIKEPQALSQLTGLIKQLFVSPQNLLGEMLNQQQDVSLFQDSFFQFVRNMLSESNSQQLNNAVLNLLKASVQQHNRPEILHALGNNLTYLATLVEPDKGLAQQLRQLAADFRSPQAPQLFTALRSQLLQTLQQLQNSLLSSDKTQNLAGQIIYNLSKYSTNDKALPEQFQNLLSFLLPGEFKEAIQTSFRHYLGRQGQPATPGGDAPAQQGSGPSGGGQPQLNPQEALLLTKGQLSLPQREELFPHPQTGFSSQETATAGGKHSSLQTIIQILQEYYDNPPLKATGLQDMNNLLRSLLASPNDFTPLVHLMLPCKLNDTRSFGELWVDADDQGAHGDGEETGGIHMLLTMDIDAIGQFELELYNQRDQINLALFCPPAYAEIFRQMKDQLLEHASASGYQIRELVVDQLLRPRSLTEVFPTLNKKRDGFDAKV